MKTKDGVEYRDGMTLFSIWLNCDHYVISAHQETKQVYGDTWQTSGSPGTTGRIKDCFVSYDNAVDSVISDLREELKDKIEHIEGQIAHWQTAKSQRHNAA